MKSTVPAAAAKLLDFISGPESNGNYLAYYGHATSTAPLPATLDDVLLWQANHIKQGSRSSAIGRYEFMPKTLRDLMREYNIPGAEAFTPDLQDELAYYLLVRRGYSKWIDGKITDATFADNLSMEWASLPYHTGKSYYDGDGLNHSLVSRSAVLSILAKAKGAAAPETKETPMTTQAGSEVAPVVTKKQPSNPFDFVLSMGENIAAQLESAVKVVVAPNNGVTASNATGSTPSTGLFGNINDAKAALAALLQIIDDAKGGKWTNEPGDVIAFIQAMLKVLTDFGVSIPGLSILQTVIADIAPAA